MASVGAVTTTGPLRKAVLLLLFLSGSLPFLVPLHLPPVTSFHAEWVAASLALLLAALTLLAVRRDGQLPLPRLIALPALFLAAIGVQFAADKIVFYQQGLLHAAYLMLAATALVCGTALRRPIGVVPLATSLAAGFAAGAVLQSVPVLLQWNGLAIAGLTMERVAGFALYGNLGQANHLADQLWLGVVSLLYLGWQGRLPAWMSVAAIAPVLAMVPYTGARAALLYPVLVAGLTVLSTSRLASLAGARRLQTAAVVTCIAALGMGILPRLWPPVGVVTAAPAERLMREMADTSTPSVRLALWSAGLRAAAADPWLGGGVGAVPLQSLVHGADDPGAASFGVAEHFHNLPINWLAEFGFPVTLAALAMLAAWLGRRVRGTWSAETWWGLAMLSVLGLHSLLEYPLWHAYFLVPGALLLGALSPGEHLRLRLNIVTGTGLLAALALGVFLLGTLREDHARLWRAMYAPPAGLSAGAAWPARIEALLAVHRDSLFGPMVNATLAAAMTPDAMQLPAKRELCRRALHFSPGPEVIFTCARIAALAGEQAEAKQLERLGRHAFPRAGAGKD